MSCAVSLVSLCPRLVETNDVPSDIDAYLVREVLVESRQELATLGEHIKETEAHLKKIRSRHLALQTFVVEHASIVSPVRRFPSEIISEIALHILDRHSARPKHVTLDTKGDAWVMGQVCRSWRASMLSFPKLWSLLDIGTEKTPLPNGKDLITELLRRSKDLPLFLRMTVAEGSSPAILKAIARQSHRWVDFQATLPATHLVYLNAASGRLPILQTLCILLHDPKIPPPGPFRSWYSDIFAVAPSLRDVVLNVNLTICPLSLPWSQLTRYDGRIYETAQYLDVLSRLDNVVKCGLWVDDELTLIRTTEYRPRLTIPSLQKWGHCENSNIVLDHLTLPGLKKIHTHDYGGELTPLFAMISRSQCSLQSMTLRWQPTDNHTIVGVMRGIPTLTKLRLTESVGYEPDFLVELVVRPDREVLLPRLEKLGIAFSARDGFGADLDSNLVVKMVESRRAEDGRVAVLKEFLFDFFSFDEGIHNGVPAITTSAAQRIRELSKEGMFIDVVFG